MFTQGNNPKQVVTKYNLMLKVIGIWIQKIDRIIKFQVQIKRTPI